MTAAPGLGHNQPPEPTLREILAEDHAEIVAKVYAFADTVEASAPATIASANDLTAVGKLVLAARAVRKEIEAARDATGRPYLEAKRTIDAWFGEWDQRIGSLITPVSKAADAYQADVARKAREKAEAEAKAQREEAERLRNVAREEAEAGRAAEAQRTYENAARMDAGSATSSRVAASKPADVVRSSSGGVTASAAVNYTFEVEDYGIIPLDMLRPYLAADAINAAIRQHVRFNKDTKPIAGVRIFPTTKATFR